MRRQVVGSRRSDRHVESGWCLDMAGSEEAEIFIRCVCEPSLRVYIETAIANWRVLLDVQIPSYPLVSESPSGLSLP